MCTDEDVQKSVQLFFKKLNTELPHDLQTSLLGTYSKEIRRDSYRYLYNHVHTSVAHNSQKVEATLVSSTDD